MNFFHTQFSKFTNNRIALNSFYNALQFIVPTLLLLGLTPILIRQMGIENYGLWMIATSTLGIMSIAEFGLNTAISKFVAEYVSSGDTRALSAVVTGGAIIYIILGFGLIVPMYMLSPTLAGVFKPSDVISDEQIGYVIRIMSLGFFPLLLRNGALAIPIGIQRFELPVLINIVYQIFSYTVALFVSLLGGSVAQIVISNIIVLWITALVSLLIAWQMLKPHHIKLVVRKTKKITNQLLSFALMSGFSSLGSRIFGFTDRLVVGAVLGLEAVAYYTVIVSVANKILQFSGALTSALMPAVSALMAKDEVQRVRAYFLRTSAVIWAINLFLMGILLIFSKPLLILWMGDAFASHALSAFRILIIIYASISVNAPAYAFANGLGIPHINALAAISGGVMMIALIFVLGPFWGLVGVALANLGYFSTFIQPIGVSKYLWSYVKETNEQ